MEKYLLFCKLGETLAAGRREIGVGWWVKHSHWDGKVVVHVLVLLSYLLGQMTSVKCHLS